MKKERKQQQPTEASNDLYTLLGTERNFNWEKFKEYVNTYDIKQHSTNDKCTFEDMLYGLATAIDGKYRWADGYKEFKKQLKEWLIKVECLIGELNKNFKRKRRVGKILKNYGLDLQPLLDERM